MRVTTVSLALISIVSFGLACGDDALDPIARDTSPEVLLPETIVGDTTPVDTTPVDTMPPQDTTPVDTRPADTTPPQDTVPPQDTMPADTTPPQDTTPADTTPPQDTTPADTTPPQDTTPADTTPPQDTTPADTTPADTTPADTTPADTTPADTTPADTADTDTGPQACPDPSRETVVTHSSIFRQVNFSGARNDVRFESEMCGDPPDSAERTYRFELTQPTEIYTATDCGWDCELVLTRDGCDDLDIMACEATIGEEAFGQVYNAGTYRLFVEGDDPEDVAPFDLMLNIHRTAGQSPCQAQALDVVTAGNCVDPFAGSPRYELGVSGQTQASDVDDFFVQDVDGCTHDGDHIGGAPDRVYSFTLPGTREVEVTLSPDGWDALLYVTGSPCGARSQVEACSDSLIGSSETVSLTLPAGTWYIVVDGFGEETFSGGASGPFDLSILVFDDACDE